MSFSALVAAEPGATEAAAFTLAQTAPQQARYEVTMQDGHVSRITIRPLASTKSYVIDQFVSDAHAIATEIRAMKRPAEAYAYCKALGGNTQQCQSTCAWAERARPFTRIQLVDGSASKVLWSGDNEAFQLNGGGGSNTGLRGECLSPDGRYLSVLDYRYGGSDDDPDQLLGPLIVDLDNRLKAVRFKGETSHAPYGGLASRPSYFLFTGWKKDAPHTLLWEYGGDEAGMPAYEAAIPAGR